MKKIFTLLFILSLSILTNGQTYNFNGKQTFKTNVGIGTASPSKLLDVNGTIKGDSIIAIRIKVTNGAANNYLLKSDASGNASWVDPSIIGAVGATGATGIARVGAGVELTGVGTAAASTF